MVGTTAKGGQSATKASLSGLGFWLPCGRTNFYDPNCDGVSGRNRSPIPPPAKTNATLDSPICKRLGDVLPTRQYVEVTRLISPPTSSSKENFYPQAILFVHDGQPATEHRLAGHNSFSTPNWPSGVPVEGLILFATVSGFYYLLAIHESSIKHDTIVAALKFHVASLFGGMFYSHYSRQDDAISADATRGGPIDSLQQYEDHNLGILNFFQINAIVEGIFNSNFHPSIFFRERAQLNKEYDTAKAEYNLQRFANMIAVHFDLNEGKTEWAARAQQVIRRHATYKQMYDLFVWVDSDLSRATILRGFLDSTSTFCLRFLKLRIERCRRALLSKMLEVIHRREPIAQAESPSGSVEQIRSENEAQLRGYIMLVSAKLPIIKNIGNHLDEQSDRDKFSKKNASATGFRLLQTAHQSWIRLLDSITDNIHEIEHAIQQSRLDRSLHEQTQMRAEQETAAELQRVRSRFGLIDSGVGSSWELPNGLGQWVGISIAAVGLLLTCIVSSRSISQGPIWSHDSFPYISMIFVILIMSLSSPFILKRWKSKKDSKTSLIRAKNNEYHYECDFHLDVPIDPEDARDLRNGAFSNARARRGPSRGSATAMRLGDKPYVHTVRVDRISSEEAAIKIHLEAKVEGVSVVAAVQDGHWVNGLRGKKEKEPGFFVLSLIYEVLANFPSGTHRCILRDVRAIALTKGPLDAEARMHLQHLIINECINVFIRYEDDRIRTDREGAEHDPSLHLDRL